MKQEDLLTLQPSWRSYFVFYAAILIFGIGPGINPNAGISLPFGLAVSIILALFILFRRKTTFYRITKDEALRAVEIGARQLREEDPEVALLLSAPKLPLSSEELEKFQRAGAVKIVADMSEELRERKELGP